MTQTRVPQVVVTLFLALAPAALASNTWYVDGVHGSDNNNCKSRQHACKTIGHAISLAHSGDSVMVAAATYTDNLTIRFSLKIVGAAANTTLIDGGSHGTVVTISNANAHVTLSKVAIRNGSAPSGAGISNAGTLAVNSCTISGNLAVFTGGGIDNEGTLTINSSTLSGNWARAFEELFGHGGGIFNDGTATINNTTISGNNAYFGAGIANDGTLVINNSTFSGNHARGGGIWGGATMQNSIVANNSGGNCLGPMTSNGYNLSSDNTCNFNSTGDMNNTDPVLGTLGNHGGPTQTIPLRAGSPAIDAGNPNGCTDGNGHMLKTDQRGKPRPDREDEAGCDMGAYERQSD